MKRKNLVKKVLMVLLGIVFILGVNNCVLAVDDDEFLKAAVENGSINGINSTNTGSTSNTNSTSNNTSNNTINSATITNVTTNTNNESVSNNIELAKTGLADNKGIIAFIIFIGVISGIYSYKKIRDYKDL